MSAILIDGKAVAAKIKEDIKKEVSLLKEKGKVEIKSFFDRLGKSDLDSQLRLIDEHKRKIDFVYETAKNDKKKKGELGYKLSLMAGIALLIILA